MSDTPADSTARSLLDKLDDHHLAGEFAALSRKVKKRPLVLFFGRSTFSDNSKYLFLRAAAQDRGYEVIWCTINAGLAEELRARGLACLKLDDDLDVTLDLLLHAAVTVFTLNLLESVGMSQPLLGCLAGSSKLQLWHGVSVKRLTLQLLSHLGARASEPRQYWLSSIQSDHVLSTASHFDAYWREVFGCRQLVRAGMPRNEVLLRPAGELELLGAGLPERAMRALESGRPAILVVPTWQRGKWTELTGAPFMTQVLGFAREHGANVFFKAHPTYFGHWQEKDREVDGLYLLDPGVDVYPWMNRFAALVTDYSSIMFDFLLTGRPVLTLDIAPGEHQSYEPDYSLVPEGEFRLPFTTPGLRPVLRRALEDDAGQAAREAYSRRVFESDPLTACDDLMQRVDQLVDQAVRPDFTVWTPGR